MASRRRAARAGNHRNYELVELQTLRDALAETGNISSAIELARQRQSAPAERRQPAGRLRELRRGRGGPRDRGEPRPATARADGGGAAAAGDRQAGRRLRAGGGASVRLPLGDGLAARSTATGIDRLAAGRNTAPRREPGQRCRGCAHPGARPCPEAGRLPRPDALRRPRREAHGTGAGCARPNRDRPLRPESRHPVSRRRWSAGSATPDSTRPSSASAPMASSATPSPRRESVPAK